MVAETDRAVIAKLYYGTESIEAIPASQIAREHFQGVKEQTLREIARSHVKKFGMPSDKDTPGSATTQNAKTSGDDSQSTGRGVA